MEQYYERTVYLSQLWIETGQQHGVIPETVEADKTAELFTLMTLGFRIRARIPNVHALVNAQDLTSLMTNILSPVREREEKG
ncbi:MULTISPECIES: hypothetical protein [Paenibacillus]|uniref:hypothetical protein n=1 Tax=Paenibacillus TaxID=44249 RepID=UPI0003A48865|nr:MULTISPECIES: hypothetical protein [Paenibacillus]MEC2345349.1 hypothetical protein [Paenibacillus barengoltzii]